MKIKAANGIARILKAEGVPVFTVGVGQELLDRDLQIGRVTLPRTALRGTTLLVDVVISQRGFDGQTITLDVEDGARILNSEKVTLPSGGDNSYPGLVWHGGQLWVSYYSSHEGKTSIYLARVEVPGK